MHPRVSEKRADLRNDIDQTSVARAIRQPTADMKRDAAFSARGELPGNLLDLIFEGARFGGEQKPAQPAFLPTQRFAHNAVQNIFPLVMFADSGLDVEVARKVVENLIQIPAGNHQLTAWRQLHTLPEDAPAGIVDGHHFLAGINAQITKFGEISLRTPKLLKDIFTLCAENFPASPASPAEPDQHMIFYRVAFVLSTELNMVDF